MNTNQTTTRYTISRNRHASLSGNRKNETPADKAKILAKYKRAESHLKAAQKELQEIGANWRNYCSVEALYYAEQIGEMLDCDHGEAGMSILIKLSEKE